ncbi:cation:proton antiporter [Levilactobacillus bambusae]|uniref:Sodium:proton antiporter n=1 Tax=Levilactobacillus bambusae TaxID=2024736 RepID=A0A2V1MWV8_9LACO|nr:cation:proton antiporter [Levilactobacillus bambusae]PWF99342.1 sodium:proton antiporter [Levilactobacillus bambusae]
MAFLGTLCLLLVLTTLAGHLCNRVGIPAVIGEILVGVLVGPALLNWIQPNHLVDLFSNIGVVILMFIGGLESDLKLLKRYLKPAILVAVIGVILPLAIMGGVSLGFGYSLVDAIFIGIIFSTTSVSISVEVLKDYHALSTKEGATILGAAVADDILGVVLLSVMLSLVGGGQTGHSSMNLGLVILLQIGFFVVTYLLVKWIAPYLMRLSERLLMASSVTIVSIVICFSMAFLAEKVGLSGAVGAFFAGIAVAQTPYQTEVAEHVEPIGYAIFIPVFFVSVGLSITFTHLNESLLFVVVMTVLACVTKLSGCGLGARWSGFNRLSSRVIGAGMISRGEMALITAQIGFSAGLLTKSTYSDVILVIILATVIAPFILKNALKKLKESELEVE